MLRNIIWTTYRKAKGILPQRTIKRLRALLESQYDGLWKNEYYSQFGEDAVIQGIFKDRDWNEAAAGKDAGPQREAGFYVDVGAYAPKQYSNTYLLYKQGWRGINIDATPGSMAQFRRVRPRDINLEAAVSDGGQELTFYSWGTPNVFNTFDADHAAKFREMIGEEPQQISIRSTSLASILDEHLPAGQPIDLLSVDAEGHDLAVLRSNNWNRYRPWLLIVEIEHDSVDDLLASEVVAFLREQAYLLRALTGPSAIFERR